MANSIQVSRGLLGALIGALFMSLLAVAFLLGRETAEPEVVAQPTPEPVFATPLSQAQSLDERLERIEKRVKQVQERETLRVGTIPNEQPATVRPPSAPAPAAPVQVEQTLPAASQTPRPTAAKLNQSESLVYFQKVDAILQDTPSLQDPNEFATKFLQRAMNGDQSEFDALIATTRRSRAELQAVAPPTSCQEHHSLLIKQLTQSEELLSEIQRSLANNDTSGLQQVAARGQAMQADTARLQQLELDLRN